MTECVNLSGSVDDVSMCASFMTAKQAGDMRGLRTRMDTYDGILVDDGLMDRRGHVRTPIMGMRHVYIASWFVFELEQYVKRSKIF